MPNTRSLHPLLGSNQGRGAGGQQDTYRGFSFCGLGLLQPCFAGIQVQTPVMQEPPLLLRGWEQGTVRPGAALGDPRPWQAQPPGPSSQDGETEAWMRGVIHSRPLSPQEPCLGRSQECWVPAREKSLGSAAMRTGLPLLPGSKWPQAPHRDRLPVPFQEGAQGCKEVDGGSVDKIPLCGSQALFCFCHLDQCLP